MRRSNNEKTQIIFVKLMIIIELVTICEYRPYRLRAGSSVYWSFFQIMAESSTT